MEDEKKLFESVALLSTYVFLKDKYPNLSDIIKESQEDIKEIVLLLSQFEPFSHLPDKEAFVYKKHKYLLDSIKDGKITESTLFTYIKKLTNDFSPEDKSYLLNATICIAHKDHQISNIEKEVISQLSFLLDLDKDFKIIWSNYQKSDFSPAISTLHLVLAGIVLLVVIILGLFFFSEKGSNTIRSFDESTRVFNEVSFNQIVVYKNKYEVENTFGKNYFLRQAVYYLSGTAEIGIDPKSLNYNSITKSLLVSDSFKVEVRYNPTLLIDVVTPEKISKDDANKIKGVITLAGTLAGAVVGSGLGNVVKKVLPPSIKPFAAIISTGAGAIVGGAGTYLIADSLLDEVHLSDKISVAESTTVNNKSKAIINGLLKVNMDLQGIYKKDFETYIRRKYQERGVIINDIQYTEAGK